MASKIAAELFSVGGVWVVLVIYLVCRGSECSHELKGLVLGALEISQLHFAGKLRKRLRRLLLPQEILCALLTWDLIQQLQLLLYAFELGVAQ